METPTPHDLAVMAFALQNSTWYLIAAFGATQAILAVVALIMAYVRDRDSVRRHDEVNDSHKETMAALSGRREDAARQHEEVMERLTNQTPKNISTFDQSFAKIQENVDALSARAVADFHEEETGH